MQRKPEYVPVLNVWSVSGEGYFNTYAEAEKRIADIRKNKRDERNALNKTRQIHLTLTESMMVDVERLADERGVKPVELVRLLIEKEVNKDE